MLILCIIATTGFTFVISGRIGAMELSLFLGLINILMALSISKKKSIALLIIIPLSFYIGFFKIVPLLPWKDIKPSLIVESRYGEIAVVEVRAQSSTFVNGQIAFTYPEAQTEELRTHLAMALSQQKQSLQHCSSHSLHESFDPSRTRHSNPALIKKFL